MREVNVEPRIVDGVHGIEIKKRGRVKTYLVSEDQGQDPVPRDLPSSLSPSEQASREDSFHMPLQPSRPMGAGAGNFGGFEAGVNLMKEEGTVPTENVDWMKQQEKRLEEHQVAAAAEAKAEVEAARAAAVAEATAAAEVAAAEAKAAAAAQASVVVDLDVEDGAPTAAAAAAAAVPPVNTAAIAEADTGPRPAPKQRMKRMSFV